MTPFQAIWVVLIIGAILFVTIFYVTALLPKRRKLIVEEILIVEPAPEPNDDDWGSVGWEDFDSKTRN